MVYQLETGAHERPGVEGMPDELNVLRVRLSDYSYLKVPLACLE